MTNEATSTGEGQALDTTAADATGATEGAAAETVVAGTEATAAAGEAEATTGPVRPDGLPDDLWDDASGVKVGDLWAAHRDLLAKEAERLADVPGADAAYDLSLPEDFKAPDGLEVEIKADDPLWAKFQEIGKEAGVPKAAFQKFVAAFADYQIAAQQADVEAYTAEKTKLGANADVRIKAADAWLKANLSEKQAAALGRALIEADGVEALEALIRLKSGPIAATGVGASQTNKFEGLHGEALLHAARQSKAA